MGRRGGKEKKLVEMREGGRGAFAVGQGLQRLRVFQKTGVRPAPSPTWDLSASAAFDMVWVSHSLAAISLLMALGSFRCFSVTSSVASLRKCPSEGFSGPKCMNVCLMPDN